MLGPEAIHIGQAALRQCVDEFGIRTGDLEQRAAALSGGNQQKLALAKFLQPDPTIIVLDEPTAGVDVELRQGLWQFIRRLNGEGHTIILTTHYLEEAEALCNRIALMKQGRVVALDTTANLMAAYPGASLEEVFVRTLQS